MQSRVSKKKKCKGKKVFDRKKKICRSRKRYNNGYKRKSTSNNRRSYPVYNPVLFPVSVPFPLQQSITLETLQPSHEPRLLPKSSFPVPTNRPVSSPVTTNKLPSNVTTNKLPSNLAPPSVFPLATNGPSPSVFPLATNRPSPSVFPLPTNLPIPSLSRVPTNLAPPSIFPLPTNLAPPSVFPLATNLPIPILSRVPSNEPVAPVRVLRIPSINRPDLILSNPESKKEKILQKLKVIQKLEGPVKSVILKPTQKLNQLLGREAPIMMLLSDWHSKLQTCKPNCNTFDGCFSLFGKSSLIEYINTMAKEDGVTVDFFVEMWLDKSDRKYFKNKQDINQGDIFLDYNNKDDSDTSLQDVHSYSVLCASLNSICPYKNIRTHMTDVRDVNEIDDKYTSSSLTLYSRVSTFSLSALFSASISDILSIYYVKYLNRIKHDNQLYFLYHHTPIFHIYIPLF